MDWGTIAAIAAVLVIVAGAQLLLLSTMLGRLEEKLGGRIDTLSATVAGLDRRVQLLEDHHTGSAP